MVNMSKRRYISKIKKKENINFSFILIIELEKRIDNRVKSMLNRGLIDELSKFHDEYNRTSTEPKTYTRGIFQAIGFKEFHDYLLLSDIERNSEHGQTVFANGRYVITRNSFYFSN